MNRSSLRSLACALALAFALPLIATAQNKVKPPPRLPPNASESSRIPAGTDTGSPVTSDALPLGTPVPPNASAGRTELTTRSAAARAAARPKPMTTSGDCTRKAPLQPSDDAKPAPVALPGSGFTGSSAGPATTAKATGARTPTRIDC